MTISSLNIIIIWVETPKRDGSDLENVERVQDFLEEKPQVWFNLDVNCVLPKQESSRGLFRLRETGSELCAQYNETFVP